MLSVCVTELKELNSNRSTVESLKGLIYAARGKKQNRKALAKGF